MSALRKQNCSVFQVKPENVYIQFDLTGCSENPSGTFKVINISPQPQRVMISEPVTEYFIIDYCRPGWLYCGDYVEVSVILKTVTERRIFYDSIQIKCHQGCEIDISIEAVPWHPYIINIPKNINFGHICLGESKSRTFKLNAATETQPFLFVLPSFNPDLTINPEQGEIKEEPIDIAITYSPTAYITASVPVFLYVPNVLCSPYSFKVSVFTKPGVQRDTLIKIKTQNMKPIQHHIYTRKNLPVHEVYRAKPSIEEPLWSHHKTNNFILQKVKAQHSPDELLGPLGRYTDHENIIKKTKEECFIYETKQNRKANISALTHHRDKLRYNSSYDRFQVWEEYKREITHPNWDSLQGPVLIRQRPIQKFNKKTILESTTTEPDMWFVRYQILGKCIELVRKLIVSKRLLKVLEKLKDVTVETINEIESIPFKL